MVKLTFSASCIFKSKKDLFNKSYLLHRFQGFHKKGKKRSQQDDDNSDSSEDDDDGEPSAKVAKADDSLSV